MNFEKWVSGYLVQVSPWIDGGKTYYLNVRYWLPGSSLSQAPALDRSFWIIRSENAEKMLSGMLDSVVNGVLRLPKVKDGEKMVITL